MRRFARIILPAALLALGFACAVNATDTTSPTLHYRWTDAAGVVHFSDTIPASALARGYEVVNNEGRVVRRVGRELTPAERRAAEAEAAQQAAARHTAQQQHLEDMQLLAAYPTEKALAESQHGQLQQINADIAALQSNLRSQEDSLTELLSQAANLQHAHQPIPPGISQRIAAQRTTVSDERKALVQRRADLANAQARFAAQRQRYRELRAKYQGGPR